MAQAHNNKSEAARLLGLARASSTRASSVILTGRHVVRGIGGDPEWLKYRAPYQIETSMPGVFVVGDVRGA
jgi:hypothetical protein